jgi:hypothetical protein
MAGFEATRNKESVTLDEFRCGIENKEGEVKWAVGGPAEQWENIAVINQNLLNIYCP